MDNFIDNFDEIISILNEGNIILYPTDTIWGLGCDALNIDAVKRINAIKHNPHDKPMIILVSDIEMLKNYVKEIHPRIETLLAFHERPLTVLFRAKKTIPEALTVNHKVAIRIIKEPVISELIKRFGRPIVATSANISEEPFPLNFNEISEKIKSEVDYIFNYKRGNKETDQPSVIASFSKSGKLKFHR